ncbi:MAG: hemerythrin domain-containing protein, partial [Leptonema sp. (in: Bacteria)]|nr:hemerythrin domain-containing protein [Leptonema sp. (in: bacteria)]
MDLSRYYQDHSDLLILVNALQSAIDSTDEKLRPELVFEALAKLSGRLMVHLAFEDKAIYPELLNSKNAEVTKLATEFQSEMATIATVFTEFIYRWSDINSIRESFDEFKEETFTIFKVLGSRVKKENEVFYPIAESYTGEL